jgi:hypothetical protein
LDQFGFDLRHWMQFWLFGSELEEAKMSAMLQDCPPVHSAYEEFVRFSSDPVMREKVRARERFLNEQKLNLAGARKEGEKKAKIESAGIMRAKGMDNALIAEITGLPVEEIDRLG